jgi:hypothetical protein
VSEERGTVSAARRGNIHVVPGTAELGSLLERFYDEVAPEGPARPWEDLVRKNSREKAIALILAVALWILVVHRAQEVQHAFTIPVQYGLLSPGLKVARVQPEDVRVTFSAARKEFTFLEPQNIRLFLNLSQVRSGRRVVTIASSDLTYPNTLYLDDIEPRQVILEIEQKPPATNNIAQ